jgi:hypothetical protein
VGRNRPRLTCSTNLRYGLEGLIGYGTEVRMAGPGDARNDASWRWPEEGRWFYSEAAVRRPDNLPRYSCRSNIFQLAPGGFYVRQAAQGNQVSGTVL